MSHDRRVIRHATVDDIAEIVRLETLLFTEDAGVHEPFADVTWPERAGADDAHALITSPSSCVLVADTGDTPIGLLMAYTISSSGTRLPITSAILRTMYVEQAHRSVGIGGELVETFLAWAGDQGCSEVQVNHYAANPAAGAFYERHGFGAHSLQRVRRL